VRRIALTCVLLLLSSTARAANVDELIRILFSEKNFKLRANAARLLGKSKDARAQGPLIEALKDEHPVVRSAACGALPAFDDVRLIGELEKMEKDRDENVRQACKAALKTLQRPKTSASTGKRPGIDLNEVKKAGAKDVDPMHTALREALKTEIGGGRQLFAVEPDTQRGYRMIGGVSCEDQLRGKDTVLYCKVNMVIARMPGKIILGSIGATGGANITNPKNQGDRAATQTALFNALAKSLIEDAVQVVNQDRAQNGEETLK
jgi:hypothetical protein